MWTRSVFSIANALMLVCVWGATALADDRPGASREPDASRTADGGRSLKIDIGRFGAFARGIVVEVAKNEDGSPTVQVEVERPATGGTGVKVDIGRDADGKPAVTVDVQRDGGNDINVDVGERPAIAKKPEPTREMENYLGIFTRPVPEELMVQLASLIGENRGLLVLGVLPDSTAATAGIRKHDILVRYDDHDVSSVDELKKQIAADKAGRTVKLTVIRAGESKTVDVVLALRPVAGESRKWAETLREAPHREAEFAIRRDGANFIISKRLIQVPGVTIRLDGGKAGAADAKDVDGSQEFKANVETKGVKQDANRKLLVTTLDGKRFKVELEYIAADGAKIERSFEGTPAEIEEKMKDLPEEIRADVRRSLMDFGDGGDKKQSRAFRFQIEPRVEGDRRLMRLAMRREGNDGETRILEVQQLFEGRESVEVADLMKIDVVAAELRELGPAIREKVEATLNRVQIPQVRVDVEKSQ